MSEAPTRMSELQVDEVRELLIESMVMFENIERNRQMPPFAQTQQQYVATGKRIRRFLQEHKFLETPE